MGTVINGSDLMLFINGKSVAFATSHKLSISADTNETTNKDVTGGWTSETVKKLSWTASSENLYADEGAGDTFGDLFDLMVAKTPITGIFTVKNDTVIPATGWTAKAKTGYTGNVIITSLEANAPDGENATFTAEFKGVGALTKVPTV
jgi:TP901-1 family phage major tail protein